jgi:hypothetical protein
MKAKIILKLLDIEVVKSDSLVIEEKENKLNLELGYDACSRRFTNYKRVVGV